MIKGQDVVILLSLALHERDQSWAASDVRSLAGAIGYDIAGTYRAIQRLETARLYQREAKRVPRTACIEFLVHGVPYVFPAHLGAETRGVPTAWGAEPLRQLFAADDRLPPVWPHPLGETRGFALEPIHPLAIRAAESHPQLRAQLTLLDARRAGDARARGQAKTLLEEWLR